MSILLRFFWGAIKLARGLKLNAVGDYSSSISPPLSGSSIASPFNNVSNNGTTFLMISAASKFPLLFSHCEPVVLIAVRPRRAVPIEARSWPLVAFTNQPVAPALNQMMFSHRMSAFVFNSRHGFENRLYVYFMKLAGDIF
jgi:hypothetical protein